MPCFKPVDTRNRFFVFFHIFLQVCYICTDLSALSNFLIRSLLDIDFVIKLTIKSHDVSTPRRSFSSENKSFRN